MDLFAGIFIVIALGSTVLVKYRTTVRTIRLRETLIEVETELRTHRGKLKAAQNQKNVLNREVKQAQRQKKALDKKNKHHQDELTSRNP